MYSYPTYACCPLCIRSEPTHVRLRVHFDALLVDCPCCGRFEVLIAALPLLSELTPSQKSEVRNQVRDRNRAGQIQTIYSEDFSVERPNRRVRCVV